MYEELKKAAECATQGEWQVIETEFPCRIGSPHIERRIFTVKDHPQLKGPYPVVNGSVALGTEEFPVYHIVSISEQDAAFIAAANPSAVLALIAENERVNAAWHEMKIALDQLKAENEALRKDAELIEKATSFVKNLCYCAGEQPSVATGYLHDILSVMSKDEAQ